MHRQWVSLAEVSGSWCFLASDLGSYLFNPFSLSLRFTGISPGKAVEKGSSCLSILHCIMSSRYSVDT